MSYRLTHDDFVRALAHLELQEGVSYQEVRVQYRKLVRQWHPDRYQQNPAMQARAHQRMTGINEAFAWLQRNQELFLIEWVDAATEEPPRTPPAHLHECEAEFVRADHVEESFQGKPIWTGDVATFNLSGHATATTAYAWKESKTRRGKTGSLQFLMPVRWTHRTRLFRLQS